MTVDEMVTTFVEIFVPEAKRESARVALGLMFENIDMRGQSVGIKLVKAAMRGGK